MKKILFFVILFSLTFSTAYAESQGRVVYNKSECHGYFVILTASGYSILAYMGGYYPIEDDVISGDFKNYGVSEMLSSSGQISKVQVIENYLSIFQAKQRIVERCN